MGSHLHIAVPIPLWLAHSLRPPGVRFAIGGVTRKNVISSLFAKRTLAAIEKKNLFFFLSLSSHVLINYLNFIIEIENIFFQYPSILFWLYIYLGSSFLTH